MNFYFFKIFVSLIFMDSRIVQCGEPVGTGGVMQEASHRLFWGLKPDGPQHVIFTVVAVHLDGVVGGVVAIGLAVGHQVDHQEAGSGRDCRNNHCLQHLGWTGGDVSHPEYCELVIDMVEECPKNAPKGPNEEEDAQLPDFIGGVGKGAKVEETSIAQLSWDAFKYGEDHVQGEVAGHGAKEDPPCKRLVPEACTLLKGKEDATYRSPKSCCHPSCCTPRDKISFFSVLPDIQSHILIECKELYLKKGRVFVSQLRLVDFPWLIPAAITAPL